KPFLGLVLNPWRKGARAIVLQSQHLEVIGRKKTATLSLGAVISSPTVRKGRLASTLTISNSDGEDIVLRGVRYSDAVAFAEKIKTTWVKFNLIALQKEAARFDRLYAAIEDLKAPVRYPAACSLVPLVTEA